MGVPPCGRVALGLPIAMLSSLLTLAERLSVICRGAKTCVMLEAILSGFVTPKRLLSTMLSKVDCSSEVSCASGMFSMGMQEYWWSRVFWYDEVMASTSRIPCVVAIWSTELSRELKASTADISDLDSSLYE